MTRMTTDAVRLALRVQPNARQNKVMGFRDNVLHIRIAAQAVDGKANQETVKYLSGVLGIPRGNLRIERGATTRNKLVAVSGLDRGRLLLLLQEATGNLPG